MGKKPVTIHLPPHLHAALKHAGADLGGSMSDRVIAAVEASLRAGTADLPAVGPRHSSPTPDEFQYGMKLLLAPVLDALAEQSAAIRQIQGLVGLKAEGAGSDTVTPQAGRVAAAATGILDQLARAGEAGMSFRDLRSAVRDSSTAAMEAAIAAFRESGVVIRKGNNWILVRPR